MTKQEKQNIINAVTNTFRGRQWFNGAGFNDDRLIIAYNYYPAFELTSIKTEMLKFGVQYDLEDIRKVLPGSQTDDYPDHIKR
jgi:hypothetical protein